MFQSAPSKRSPEAFDPILAAQFEDLFGPVPTSHDFPDPAEFRKQKTIYGQQQKYFAGIVSPRFDHEQVENAFNTLNDWGVETPVFYQHRYEILARFPNTPFDFTTNEAAVIGYTHQTIAAWQAAQINRGVKVARVHPFLPPKYVALNEDLP